MLTKIVLSGWDALEIIDDAQLVAVELVTNAMRIGGVLCLTLAWQGDGVMIEVWDGSEAPPDRRQRSLDRVDGRGLLLVEACSKDWGWRLEDQGGKTVWAIVGGYTVLGDTFSDTPGTAAGDAHSAVPSTGIRM